MAGGYVRLMQIRGNEKERHAHDRLTSLAKAIQAQLGYSWAESVRLADEHIYGPWRRHGDNGGPLLEDAL
jgi:hypothetical protein